MLLDKILNPRWKHKNPQVRKRALQSLDPSREESQKIFLEVLGSDPELFVRRFAIQRLTNVSKLQEIRESDEQSEIIEEATNRLCKILATVDKQHPVSYLKNKLSSISENRILEHVALHTNDQELQLLAIDKIANESVLIEILHSTTFSNNKKHALEKLASVNSLKRAVKVLKRKDNELASLAQSMLDKLIEYEQLVIELQKETRRTSNEILELLNLCKFSNEWLKYEARFRQLQNRYQELIAERDSQHRDHPVPNAADVEQAFGYFEQQLVVASEKQAKDSRWDDNQSGQLPVESRPEELDQLEKCQKELQEFLTQLSQATVDVNDPSMGEYPNQAAELKQRWRGICSTIVSGNLSADQGAEFKELQSNLNSLQDKAETLLKDLGNAVRFISVAGPLNEAAIRLLENQEELNIKDAQQLLGKYSNNKTADNAFIPAEFHSETQRCISELSGRLHERETALQKQSDEFESLVEKLDAALADGKAKTVKPLVNRARKILKQLPASYLSKLDKKGLPKKFHQQQRRADSLLGWQQWSSLSAKEKLVDAMEKLADLIQENAGNSDFDFSKAAEEISKSREQWRHASAGTARDDKLWENFDAACNRAYEPCQKFFERQNQERNRNLQAREQVCQDLEKYVNSIQKSPVVEVDWKATEKIIQVARRDWNSLGEVKRGDWENINRRFRDVLNKLEKLVRQRREDNGERKRQLINRVNTVAQQLQDSSVELEAAIETVKKLQSQWRDIGAANREKQLWDAFRSACNSVFEVRKSEREQQKQQLVAIDQQREQIVEKIQRCTELEEDELLQVRAEVEQLQSDWRSLPKLKKGHRFQRQFEQASDGFVKKIQQFHDNQLREIKQLLQKNVAGCYQLENCITDYFEGRKNTSELEQELSTIEKQWNMVSEKTLKFSRSIDRRFNDLKNMVSELIAGRSDVLQKQIEDQRETSLQAKEDLCIQMEILAKKESPESSKQRRLEIQVGQLANTMKQLSSPDIAAELQNLLSQWHTSGFILFPESSSFERRFYSALESLDKDYQYPI